MCSGGMSTSLLVTKMKKAAEKAALEVEISANGSADPETIVQKNQPDVLLLGPQIRYMFDDLKQKLELPVGVINSIDYGMMDGEKVLQQALDLMESVQG